MTQRLQRFDATFLRDLRGPLSLYAEHTTPQIEELPPAPPAPTYSSTELEAARMAGRKEGFTEGFEAGQAQAKKDADALMVEANSAIRRFGEALTATQNDYQHVLTQEASEISNLVLAIAKKVAGEALQTHSVEAIMAMVSRCLPVLFSKPRVMVDVHPDIFEKAIARIESALQEFGFEGEMQFRANPALGPHDIALDWGTGQASRSTAALWSEIEALLERTPPGISFPTNDHSTAAPSAAADTHTLGDDHGR